MEKGAKKPCVLVTGASGMLANAFAGIAGTDYKILSVSRRKTPHGLVCDLSQEQQVRSLFESHPIDLVVHAAAYSDVDGCERDPKTAYESNVLASKYLSETCSKQHIPWIYVSTDYVFDGRKTSPYAVNDPTGPVNIYGLTKWCGEHYARTCPVSSVVVRTSWLFGHGNNPHNFVSYMMDRLRKEKKVEALDNQTDCPTSMKDLSQALMKIGDRLMREQAKHPDRPWHDLFHICNSGGTTRYEMTCQMKEWMGLKEVRVEKADIAQFKDRPALRPPYMVMSAEHYEKTFNVRLRPWQESLKEYVMEAASCAS